MSRYKIASLVTSGEETCNQTMMNSEVTREPVQIIFLSK